MTNKKRTRNACIRTPLSQFFYKNCQLPCCEHILGRAKL